MGGSKWDNSFFFGEPSCKQMSIPITYRRPLTHNGGVGCPAEGKHLPEKDAKAPHVRLAGEFL